MLEKLLLCHERDDAPEVHALAEALRLRGVVPWVDQQGGFLIGDENVGEARRVIREECFGLLLYATPKAFDSDFIRRVEIDTAVRTKDEDNSFVLVAVPRGLGFGELSRRSTAAFGVDLAAYASRPLGKNGEDPGAMQEHLDAVALDVLRKVLRRASGCWDGAPIQLQYSTRERLADEPGDLLCLDATRLLGQRREQAVDAEAWRRVHAGLDDVKQAIAAQFGRPRLRLHGSKHLAAAFLLGYVFPSTAFELELRTKQGYWATDALPTAEPLLRAECRDGSAASETLHVELSTLDQPVQAAVRRHVQRTGRVPLVSLRLTADATRYSGGVMSNADAVAIARQVRQEVARMVAGHPVSEIHLFAAVPQGLATMIGHRLNALPPVQLYEYDGQEYHPNHRLC